MKKFKIELFPSPILRRKSRQITVFDKRLEILVASMKKFMKSQPSGIGLAAPQIGLDKQIALVDVSHRVKGAKCLILINPKIIEYKDEIISREGCMSLPEYRADLKRFNQVLLQWKSLNGQLNQRWFEGIEARCVQHEVDHLNGHLFFDRVAQLKTDMIPRIQRVR